MTNNGFNPSLCTGATHFEASPFFDSSPPVPQFTVSPPCSPIGCSGGEMIMLELPRDRLLREATVAVLAVVEDLAYESDLKRVLERIREHADEAYKPKG